MWRWRWMDGYVSMRVWVMVVLWEWRKEGGCWDGEFCTVSLEGGQRPPRQQRCPYSGGTKQNGLPLCPQRPGHPACHRGRLHQSTVCSPQFTPLFLSLPGAVCSAKQNNVKPGPNYTGLNAFTCDPHSLDDALTNRAGIKPICLQWSQMIQKKQKQNSDRLELWSSAGNAGPNVLPECLHSTDTIECVGM